MEGYALGQYLRDAALRSNRSTSLNGNRVRSYWVLCGHAPQHWSAHRVDLAHVTSFGRRSPALAFDDGVGMAGLDHGAERVQPIALDIGFRAQVQPRPARQHLAGEARNRRDHRVQWMALLSEFHGDDERALALRAAPRLAPIALSAQVRIVDLHEARQLARRRALRHRLVLGPPRGFVPWGLPLVVVHAQVALKHQGRRVVLGCGQQADRQQSGAQRQLGGQEDDQRKASRKRVAEQRHLMKAGSARVVHLFAAAKERAPAAVTSRAAEAMRLACPVQGAVGLRFGAALLHELEHRQALLELHDIDRDDDATGHRESAIVTRRRRKSRDRGLRLGADQLRRTAHKDTKSAKPQEEDRCRTSTYDLALALRRREHMDSIMDDCFRAQTEAVEVAPRA